VKSGGGSNDVAKIVDVPLLGPSSQREQITLLRYEVDHEAIWLRALAQLHTKFVELVFLEEFAIAFVETLELGIEIVESRMKCEQCKRR
jgi:hypothetical protein